MSSPEATCRVLAARLGVVGLVCAIGCGRNDAERGVLSPQALPHNSATDAEPSVSSLSTTHPVASGAAVPKLSLDATVRTLPEGVGVSIRNRGSEPVSLKRAVSLEREGKTIENSALTLQLGCAPTACVTLLPGTELLAPHWLDLPGAERCDTPFLPHPARGSSLRLHACEGELIQEIALP